MGVIAQEVEAVFPELVSSYGEKGYKASIYAGLVGVLIKAVKEMETELDALRVALPAGKTLAGFPGIDSMVERSTRNDGIPN